MNIENKIKKQKIPRKYVPKYLTKKDKIKQYKEIMRSKKMYKKRKYHVRDKIKSFKTKKSKHKSKFMKMYNLKEEELTLSKISNKTRCKKKGLKKIINKGMGAYYSSGSRPNQTPYSWGVARLYSALTGGPASKIDKKILLDNCKKNSKIIKLL